METNSVLEQLRADYNVLKERLDEQEIINDRLLQQTFRSQLKQINNKAWASVTAAIFVIIIAPMAFHYNPSFSLSWAFVAATDVMMAICIWFTIYWHRAVKLPDASKSSMKQFAQSLKCLKQRYQTWLKYASAMIGAWLIWICVEVFMNSDDIRLAVFMMTSVLVGALVGGIIGLKMHFAVVRKCDEIISQIEE